jgi:hypothetical protein
VHADYQQTVTPDHPHRAPGRTVTTKILQSGLSFSAEPGTDESGCSAKGGARKNSPLGVP